MAVILQSITTENWAQCVRLSVGPEQKQFVASNAFSLAQAAYEVDCVPQAIYDGEIMVGFVMYWHLPGEPRYHINRLMVDAAYQQKGYGRAAMEQVLLQLKAQPNCQEIDISYEPQNDVARLIYASLGFRETGEFDDGEVVALFSVAHKHQS